MDRFWSKVDIREDDECWLWTAGRTSNGYGKIKLVDGEKHYHERAHRLAYLLKVGDIPDGLVVMHTCDVKLCTNPKHLKLGTVAENNADMVAKGRNTRKFIDTQVLEMHRLRADGWSIPQLARKYGTSEKTIRETVGGARHKRIAAIITDDLAWL